MNTPVIEENQTGFAALHPMTQLLFFASVISITLGMNPLLLALSGAAAAGLAIRQRGLRAFVGSLRVFLPTGLLLFLLNPIISHNGVTILAYFPDGAPLTLESIYFGAAAAWMMLSLFGWFSCLQRVLRSDRVIYLFGRLFPRIALLISMILRLSGTCRSQWREIKAARIGLGEDPSRGSLPGRLRCTLGMISTLFGWLLENSLDTADSMKSRGFGTARRRVYVPFRYKPEDLRVCLLILLPDIFLMVARWFRWLEHRYYPVLVMPPMDLLQGASALAFGIIAFLPLLVDGKEALRWQFLKLKT